MFGLTPMGLARLGRLDAIIAAWSEGVHPFGHHVTNPVLEATGVDTARCDTKLIVILADGRACTGVYTDELTRTPAGWPIAYRRWAIRSFNSLAGTPVFARNLAA